MRSVRAPFGYTAIGEQVGMAQRMESVAPPGGVMLSESTARLVENAAVLGEPEMVRIKGAEDAVPARRLLRHGRTTRPDWSVGVDVGRPRVGVDHVGGDAGSVDGWTWVGGGRGRPSWHRQDPTRRVKPCSWRKTMASRCFPPSANRMPPTSRSGWWRVCCAPSRRSAAWTMRPRGHGCGNGSQTPIREDLLLLDDLLGVADPDVALPKIDPDARRRRLTALINAAQLARTEPAVFVVEDVHWIDEVSESMLADFLAVIPQTPSMVLITYRPEYHGALQHVAGCADHCPGTTE